VLRQPLRYPPRPLAADRWLWALGKIRVAINNVLYILGAGFSAPLGRPVISNFLTVSKDMYQREPKKYEHFALIYDRLDRIGKAKSYVNCDLFNIEEILSILEMESYVTGKDLSREFTRYIADVVTHCTPRLVAPGKPTRSDWFQSMFDAGDEQGLSQIYFEFVAKLFNLVFRWDGRAITSWVAEQPKIRYGVITLNYDLVIENIVAELNRKYAPKRRLDFLFEPSEADPYGTPYRLSVAKLHGSLHPLTIVPPTWNKTRGPEIEKAWKLAKRLISHANYLRFVGYSLAPSDLYIRYLLITGILDSMNLKGIDVISLDPGQVHENYKLLFTFSAFRFAEQDVRDHLRYLACPNGLVTGEEFFSDSRDEAW